MATTVERRTRQEDIERSPVVIYKLPGQPPVLAGNVILEGTIAFLNSAGKVIPATNGVAGTVLLGIAEATYDATGGSDVGFNMVFKRGAFYLDGKNGDLPTATDLGKFIAINDNSSVKKTVAMNDVTVKLLSIDNGQYKCELV